MHHEVKHQAVITYYALVLGQNIGKEEARRTMLTREQFLEVHEYQLCFDITYVMFDLLMYQLLRDVQLTPWWSRTKADAWALEVDKWFTEEYQQAHDAARERRLMMEGPSHHQGQRSLPEYKELWVRGFLIDFEAQTCFITLIFVLFFCSKRHILARNARTSMPFAWHTRPRRRPMCPTV
jgi:hypothetical protein